MSALMLLLAGQVSAIAQPAITMVSTVGCVVKITEPGRPPRWMLTRATEPDETRDPFGSRDPAHAKRPPLGTLEFRLDGVIEYLSEEDRQEYREAGDFIVPIQEGSAGQLRDGHKVALTGLLVAAAGAGGAQITITSVASVEPTCP